ncbi:MAG: TIGR03619 family F420-dependent LLM class oxidoreductase [Steroidobacteraceae bacterium]
MKVGGPFAFSGALATRANILTTVARLEQLGFDHIWMGEHIYHPKVMSEPYPHTADGRLPYDPEENFLEIVSTYSFVAAATTTLRLHTNILMPAMRQPFLAAKQLSTLDYLSTGRLDLGLGLGWMPEEYALAGVPWKTRGRYLDEWILAIRAYMAGEAFEGRFYRFREGFFAPMPVQSPLPIWIGGDSDAAMQRAARLGQGWQPVGPRDAFVRATWLEPRLAKIAEARSAQGKDMSDFSVMTSFAFDRREPARMLDELSRLAHAGVTHVNVRFGELSTTDPLERVLDDAAWIAAELMPSARCL